MIALGATVSGWFSRRAESATSALPVRLGGRGSFAATTQVAPVRGFDQPLVWVVVALMLQSEPRK